jgi:hypothetical protein
MKKAIISDGVVTNIIKVDPENIPEWAVSLPDAGPADVGWTYDGNTYAPPVVPPEPVTNEKLNEERDRRVLEGNTFEVNAYGPVTIAGDDTTIRNLQGLALAAQLRMSQGDLTTITNFRDETNVVHQLVPAQVIDLWSQGAAYVSALFQSAWALKDNPAGIPNDYQDDKYWP